MNLFVCVLTRDCCQEALGSSPDSEEAMVALLNFAELRSSQERWAEAEALARRALALNGGDPSVRGAALANVGG